MTQQEIIDEIMDFMEFEKIQKAMDATNWCWQGVVPKIYEMRQILRKLIKELFDKKLSSISTGGFVVSRFEDMEGEHIKVAFELSSWTVDY